MTAIKEALQALEQHPDATVRNTASFVRAALSQEVPRESVAEVCERMNENNEWESFAVWEDGVDPPPRGTKLYTTPQVKVAAQEPGDQIAREVAPPAAAAPSGELPPLPESFAQYIADNYNGEIVFSNPRWHAERIWRSAAWHMRSYAKAARGEK